jgi:hypothetical protein
MRVSLCYELISSAERNKKDREREREGQANGTWEKRTMYYYLNVWVLIAHAHQSQARRLASDHCATENHRPNLPSGLYDQVRYTLLPVRLTSPTPLTDNWKVNGSNVRKPNLTFIYLSSFILFFFFCRFRELSEVDGCRQDQRQNTRFRSAEDHKGSFPMGSRTFPDGVKEH